MITIKATHVDGLAVFPSWVSNGRWAIRKDCIANAAAFASLEAIRAFFPKLKSHTIRMMDTDDGITRVMGSMPAESLRAFAVTRWTYEGSEAKDGYALLTCGGLPAFVDRAHLALLGAPSVLYGANGESALTDAVELSERTIVTMPCRIAKDGSHLTPIIDLVRAMPAKDPELAEVGR